MRPTDFQQLAVALAMGEGPREGLAGAVDILRDFAPECVPDKGRAREALTAWGIDFEDGGEPIHQMFTQTKTLKVRLPAGWTFSRRGGGGHVELLDARGASRLHWHIHGWDPISLDVRVRFYTRRLVDLSASEAVVHVVDGPTVIHTIPLKYPHARITDREIDGSTFYKNGYEGEDAGWTREMGAANYKVEQDAYEEGKAWLDKNRPGHRDDIRSWLL